jgi:hypothetical protein
MLLSFSKILLSFNKILLSFNKILLGFSEILLSFLVAGLLNIDELWNKHSSQGLKHLVIFLILLYYK